MRNRFFAEMELEIITKYVRDLICRKPLRYDRIIFVQPMLVDLYIRILRIVDMDHGPGGDMMHMEPWDGTRARYVISKICY